MPRSIICFLYAVAPLLMAGALQSGELRTKDGAILLFNGKDLSRWGYQSGEKFDGKTESDDKRFAAKDGMIVVNPGKGIKRLCLILAGLEWTVQVVNLWTVNIA